MKPKWLSHSLTTALVALALFPSASQAQLSAGNYTLTGTAEAGAFLNPQPATNVAKYREYQDLAQQIIAPELRFLLHDQEQRVFADFHALNVGQTNELYDLHFGSYGLLDIDAQWQEIPRFLSDGVAKSPYEQSSGNFTLPSKPAAPTPNAPQGSNISSWLDSTARPLSLSLLEGIANLTIRYTPDPRWTYSAYLNYLNESGNSPYGEIFGPNPGSYNESELFAPIQYDTYNYGTGVQYADGTWLFGIQYEGSIFKDQYADLTWQNPNTWSQMTGPGGSCADSATYPGTTGGNGPCRGQDYTYPGNQAHTFEITAGRTLPLDTHLMGTFSYGWWLQDEPFIPYTSNTALPKQALPRNSLGGDVSPLYANFTVVSRPLDKLRLKTTYSYFDYANHDPAITFNGVNSLNDVASLWTATAYPFSFSTQTINAEASYSLTNNLVASLVGNIETYHNSGMMVLQQDMTSYGPVVDWTPYQWLQLRASYQHAFRDSPGYNNDRSTLVNQDGGIAEFSQLYRFDEASVQVDQFSLYGDAQPFSDSQAPEWLQDFTLYAEMDYDNYFYPSSSYGLQNWSDYTPSVGINWTPSKNLNLYGDWSWTATDYSMQSFQRQNGGTNEPNCPTNPQAQTPALCPGQSWTGYGREQGNSIDFGFDFSFPTDRVIPWLTQTSHLIVQYNYTVTTDLNHANGNLALGGATDFPNIGSRFNELIVTYAYPIKKNMTFTIGYYLSNFGENDFGYDRLMPWMASSPQSMFLGNSNWTPFTGNAAYMTVKYAF
ncbi:MAG TPA: MtrB/PioB family outer membrane beta-barrel protein [Candidatus Binataceae bacterium]|nr:MtrB/PioB family outer membrane beta-barrel protein [Candidatus Binataceae bacterium]